MVLVGAIPPLSSSRLQHGLQQRLLGEATELLLHEITDNPAARSTSIPSAPGSVHLTLHRHNTDTCDSTLDRLLWWRRLPLPFAPARPRAWYARYPRSDGEVGSHPTRPSDCGAIHRLGVGVQLLVHATGQSGLPPFLTACCGGGASHYYGCVPSPCSLDASVAGFSKLVPPRRSAVQGCKFDCSLCPSTPAVCAVAVLARRGHRWLL
jgi:hypothetical protein